MNFRLRRAVFPARTLPGNIVILLRYYLKDSVSKALKWEIIE